MLESISTKQFGSYIVVMSSVQFFIFLHFLDIHVTNFKKSIDKGDEFIQLATKQSVMHVYVHECVIQ